MTTAQAPHLTLAHAMWPRTRSQTARVLALAVAGTALLAISAKIQVPFWPVPMTMQTFVVLVIAAAYGSRLGGATLALYLAEGAVGLPVFAKGGGAAYFAGPTGGYLVGFMAAAVVVGWLAERGWDRTMLWTLAAMLTGTVIIFMCGIAWLSTLIGLDKAIAAGLMPFLISEGFKVALGAAVLPLTWQVLRRLGWAQGR